MSVIEVVAVKGKNEFLRKVGATPAWIFDFEVLFTSVIRYFSGPEYFKIYSFYQD